MSEPEKRKLTEKCSVILHDTETGMRVEVDNEDTDEYTLKFDFGNSENVEMKCCEGVKVTDQEEMKCEMILPAATKKDLANMNIKDMGKGSMSVRYKTNISVKRGGKEGSNSTSGSKSETSPSKTSTDPATNKVKTTTTTTKTTTSSSSSSGGPPASSSSSSSMSMSMKGTVSEDKKPEPTKASPEEERKIGKDVFFSIKKNFEGYIVYVHNKSTDPCVVTSDFSLSVGVDIKPSPGVQKKGNDTTFSLRVDDNYKLPFVKLIAKDKAKIDDCKVDYKAEVAADMSAHALSDMHAKLKAKAEAREKMEAESKSGGSESDAAVKTKDAAPSSSSGQAMVAGKGLKDSLSKLDAERKITDTLTFIVKASVDGYQTYLDSKDEDPYVVTVDFAGCKNLNFKPMVGCNNVGGDKYAMTIEAGRKLPFVTMKLVDKTNFEWSLQYNFTYKNDNSLRQAADKMKKARERQEQ